MMLIYNNIYMIDICHVLGILVIWLHTPSNQMTESAEEMTDEGNVQTVQIFKVGAFGSYNLQTVWG